MTRSVSFIVGNSAGNDTRQSHFTNPHIFRLNVRRLMRSFALEVKNVRPSEFRLSHGLNHGQALAIGLLHVSKSAPDIPQLGRMDSCKVQNWSLASRKLDST